jgi:hypothetical protein
MWRTDINVRSAHINTPQENGGASMHQDHARHQHTQAPRKLVEMDTEMSPTLRRTQKRSRFTLAIRL